MIYYFDNCATTQVDENIVQILAKYHTERYFNPSARSSFSLQVANDIAISREQIAKALGCATNEIVFTGGGTEADNLAIFGSLRAKRGNIVITQAEHAATYNPVAELNNRGYEVRYANVLPDGHIDVEDFVSKVNSETLLACFVHVNNETGAVNDVCNINKLVKSRNPQTITFSDGIQAVGKILVNLRHLGVDLYSFAGHKIHCTKGIGALYIKQGVRIVPNVFGGGQEKGLRSGTEYVGGIVALASAVNTALKNLSSNTSNFEQYKQTILFALRDIPDWKQICSREASQIGRAHV